jgi:hypothetical protein
MPFAYVHARTLTLTQAKRKEHASLAEHAVKLGLGGIELLPVSKEDALRASLAKYDSKFQDQKAIAVDAERRAKLKYG